MAKKKAKRGKVKARELKNVRIDFVSVVTRGANAEKFEIFKAADGKPKKKVANSTDIDKKDGSVWQRILNILKGKSNEEEISMSKAEEILEALKGLTGKVDDIGKRVDKIEGVENDDGDGDDGEEGEEAKEKAAAEAKVKKDAEDAAAAKAAKAAEGETDEEKKEKAAEAEAAKKKKDEETAKAAEGDDVLKAIKGVGDKLDTLTKRVETVEKARTQSNAITNDKTETKEGAQAKKDDELFKGTFGSMKKK